MPERSDIEAVVTESIRLLAEDFEMKELNTVGVDSVLYGDGGSLDSMALVNLIADIEDAVAEKFGVSIALADEKAMSARNSPFRTVASLTDAVAERIKS